MNRTTTTRLVLLVLGLLVSSLAGPAALAQAGAGNIAGQVVREDGSAIGGVTVVVNETGDATVADADGRYRINGVQAGTYTLTFSLGDNIDTEEGVEVTAGQTTDQKHQVDWQVSFAETIVVTSASRRAERIVDAPAAISVVSHLEIKRDAPTGQVPKLLEFQPGVDMTQGGLYDFNINTRGFNSSLTRRVAVLVDGRNPATPFLANQEWSAASLPLDDLESMEMLRGPSAALYGANASSGVINMTTRAPRASEGALLRFTAGELSTVNADGRYATGLGNEWYLKLLGGFRSGETFSVSRQFDVEYLQPCAGDVATECLPLEGAPLVDDGDVDVFAGALRLDKYIGSSLALTLEGGSSDVEGPVFQTNIGRVQVVEAERPWFRFNLNHPHWNFTVNRSERDALRQPTLGTGLNLRDDSHRAQAELQGNWELGQKGRIVAGASFVEENFDSFDIGRGIQTLVFDTVETEATAAFAQLDLELTGDLKLVLAGRWDDSDTFYENEFSPKAALVWGATPNNTLRFSFNQGFQSPAIFELFLQVDAAPMLNLQPFEAFCTPFGVNCGFGDPTRVLAVGNLDLGIEEVTSFEIGYSGILADKAYLTIDYYNTRDEDFISDLVSTQFTPLGDFNTVFGSYAPPAGLPAAQSAALLAQLQAALGPSFALLSNNFDGTPILAAASYVSFGEVDTQGVDVGVNYYLDRSWTVTANYSWFDFDIKRNVPGLENFLSPNSPEHSIRAGVSYVGDRFDFSTSGRWVDTFFWATGPFVGNVQSYTTFDASAGYELRDNLKLGLNVSNLLDNEHWETLGGELIGRRALASIEILW